jgi:hypothetical protein
MVVASFIILTFSLLYDSYTKKGEIVDVIALFKFFMGLKTVSIAWVCLSVMHFLIILITKIALISKLYVWIPLYILHISSVIIVATYFSKLDNLGFGSIMIIMAESIRIIMKGHSYLRTKLLYLTDNPYKHFEFRGIHIVNSTNSHEREKLKDNVLKISIKNGDIFSEIKKLSYFFFVPTLMYRD